MTHSILLGLQKEKTMRDVANQSLGLFILLIIVSAIPAAYEDNITPIKYVGAFK